MAQNFSKEEVVHRFFSGTGFSYDQVAAICTCGFDGYWKKKIMEKILGNPDRIIDQACGTGILTIKIARAFPFCKVIGVELRQEYLGMARDKARKSGMRNIEFILGRAEDVLPEGSYDCVTSSYLAKYAELESLIRNIRRMLRPGGRVIIHDFTCPSNQVFQTLWRAYFALLRVLGSRIYPQWRTVFRELPEFIKEATWVSESVALLRENDFCDITMESYTFGTSAIVTARRP